MSPKSTGGQKADQKLVEVGGPARAAARPLSFAEALLNEVEPGFNTPMRRWRGGFTRYAIAADPTRDLDSIEECGGERALELWSHMEGMSARSLRELEELEGAFGGVFEH